MYEFLWPRLYISVLLSICILFILFFFQFFLLSFFLFASLSFLLSGCSSVCPVWIFFIIRAQPENWDEIGLWEYYVTKYHNAAKRANREANILNTCCHFPFFLEDFLLSIGEKYSSFQIPSKKQYIFRNKNIFFLILS